MESPMLKIILVCALIIVSLAGLPHDLVAQETDTRTIRAQILLLFDQDKPVDALPLLEKLAVAEPDDADTHFLLGQALLAKGVQVADPSEKAKIRIRSRNAFILAGQLGKDENLVKAFVELIPPDGSSPGRFSNVAESEAATSKGEVAFTSGDLDGALGHYKRALELDPKNYYAALFAGDMYLKKNDHANAEVWYQKAISIDPLVETAYRYSATPLMRQRKFDQARDRYIDAWITAPYSRFAVQGMIQWGDATKTGLSHPKVEIPKVTIGEDGKAKTTVNISPLANDGSMAWMSYSLTREQWKNEKFKKTFPAEKNYRRSLAEEVEALRSVVTMAKSLKPKELNEEIATIDRMDKDGVLEAFVLMTAGDEEIYEDHIAYLKANRDKMRKYVLQYVIQK
jgi:tetratricopeptide (TPR) repeat protein